MTRNRHWISLPLTVIGIFFTGLWGSLGHAGVPETGEKGAQIYCFMRTSGNDHEVSWKAAYAVIKRQTNSLFKTSPKHGAVMIIEAVVQDPNSYQDCGSYLGDLFGASQSDSERIEAPSQSKNENRYSY